MCLHVVFIEMLDYCSSQPSMVHWLSSPIFPCLFGCPVMVTSQLLLAPDPQPIYFLKANDNSYSKMKREHKYKDKDNDKDKDAERITETQIVFYIFRILMTHAFQE